MTIDWNSIKVSRDTLIIDTSRLYLIKIVKEISENSMEKSALEEEVKKELHNEISRNNVFSRHFFLGHGDYDPVKGWEHSSVEDVLDGMATAEFLNVVNANPKRYTITDKGEQMLQNRANDFQEYLFSKNN